MELTVFIIFFSVAFWLICFLKNREVVTEYSFFRRLCRHLAILRPKKSLIVRELYYIYIFWVRMSEKDVKSHFERHYGFNCELFGRPIIPIF